MPSKGAQLVPFLQNALEGVKYRNLIYMDPIKKVFCLYLPHKTNRLCIEDQLIFKDWWDARRGKKYVYSSKHYTEARQAMTSSLRKSDYVEPMCLADNKLLCRILSKEEVEEKKKLKKELKLKIKHEDNESGYESCLNSPESFVDGQNDKDLLQGIKHDHDYLFCHQDRDSGEGSQFNNDVQNTFNEDTDMVTEAFDSCIPLGTDSSSELESIIDDYLNENLSEIFPVLEDFDYSLESLFNIPNEQLIGGSFKELQLSVSVSDSNDVETNTRKTCYFCQEYELLGKAAVLICKLIEMDVDVAGTSSNIGIVFGETIWKTIQGYTCIKRMEYVGDKYLIVILELPSMSI